MLTLPHGCFLVCLRRNCRFCRTFYLKLFTALLCNSKKRECILWLSQLRPLNEHSDMNVKFEVWPTKWPWKLVYFPKPLAFGHRCWCSFSKPTFKKPKKLWAQTQAEVGDAGGSGVIRCLPVAPHCALSHCTFSIYFVESVFLWLGFLTVFLPFWGL